MTMKLWHCAGSRSLRPLWALEEMGFNYQLELLPFPPRIFQRDYLAVNPLGTVPFFTDGELQMTESTGICHYLVEKYRRHDFGVAPEHPDYGNYLNWLYQSDATLTFPQTLVLRYAHLEPAERRQPQVAEDYRKWYLARLKRLNGHLLSHDYLSDERFTIADIAVGFALYLGELLGLAEHYEPQVRDYLQRLKARPAFQRAEQLGGAINFINS